MAYYKSRSSAFFDAFSLTPVPYPVLLILAVLFLFLGFQWYVSYEDIVEATHDNMGWLLMAAPLVLLFAILWLSNSDAPGWSPGDRRRRGSYFGATEGGSSPWGVAALIVLLLVLVQYQSAFLESWFG